MHKKGEFATCGPVPHIMLMY